MRGGWPPRIWPGMFHSLLSQSTTLLMVATCVAALMIGRWPERVTALAYSVNWIGSALWQDRDPALRHHVQTAWVALDSALLVVLLVLTVMCRRRWLLWMSAFSLLVVLTHVSVLMDDELWQWSYVTAYYVWSLGALLSFAVGVALEGRKPVVLLLRLA